MIVVEESDVRKSQMNPQPQPHVATATSSTPLIPVESPPAYTPREGPCPSSSFVPPYHGPPPPPATQKRRPKSAAVRFFEALVLAFGAYVAIVFAVKLLMHAIRGPPHDVRWTCHVTLVCKCCSEVACLNLAPRNDGTS